MQLPGATISIFFGALLGKSFGRLHILKGHNTVKYQVGVDIGLLKLAHIAVSLPEASAVRFEELTSKEASLLPAPVCERIDINCWCDCYRDLGREDYLMNHFSSECIRSIPVSLFSGLRPEDMPMLGTKFLQSLSVKQVEAIRRETRLAMSDSQLTALISSNMNGLTEMGENCKVLTKLEIRHYMEKRPNIVANLTPECIRFFGRRLTAVSSQIFSDPNLLQLVSVDDLQYIPKRFLTTGLIESIFANNQESCDKLNSSILELIPCEAIHVLGKECWNVATKGMFSPFIVETRVLRRLPADAWSAVPGRFFATLTISGGPISPSEVKELLENIGKDNKASCSTVLNFIKMLNNSSAATYFSPECIASIPSSSLRSITSTPLVHNFPIGTFKRLSAEQIRALEARHFAHLPDVHATDLSNGPGCAGLCRQHMISMNASGSKSLSLLTASCVASIKLDELLSLSDLVIARFSDAAFTGINRMSFNERDDARKGQLLALLTPEQFKAFGDARIDELHICHGADLNIASILSGRAQRPSDKRKISLGPILVNNCIPFVVPNSLKSVRKEDVSSLGDLFLSILYNPTSISMIPDEIFGEISQKQLDGLKPNLCAGLRADQIKRLGEKVNLTSKECLARMCPKEIASLIRIRKALKLPLDIARVISADVMEKLSIDDLLPTDFTHLGKSIPEASNPCKAISATKVPGEFLESVDEYCIAHLKDLEKLKFDNVKKHLTKSKLRLLRKEKMRELEAHGWDL